MTVQDRPGAGPEADRDLSPPPHSAQAEEAVLGSVLKNPACIARVADILRPDDFYAPRNRHVFKAMLSLYEHLREIDYHTIADELHQLGLYEASGGMVYLADLDLVTPTSALVTSYAEIVQRTAVMRRLISAAQDVATLAYRDSLQVGEAIEHATALVQACRPEAARGSLLTPEAWASHFLDDFEARLTGRRELLSSGFLEIDAQIGGFEGGRLYLLMGVPGSGKSEIALQIAQHVGKRYGRVLFVSLEMMPDELAARWIRLVSGINRNWLAEGAKRDQQNRRIPLAPEDLERISQIAADIALGRVHTSYPPGGYTTAHLQNEAVEVQGTTGERLALIVTDYLQRFTDRADPRRADPVRDIGLVAEKLKSIARELNVPLLAPVQPNRDYSDRADKRPLLSDLRESGRLEIEADVVLGLFRPPAEDDSPSTSIETHMLKNRSGVGEPDGFHVLRWLGNRYGDPGSAMGRDPDEGRHYRGGGRRGGRG